MLGPTDLLQDFHKMCFSDAFPEYQQLPGWSFKGSWQVPGLLGLLPPRPPRRDGPRQATCGPTPVRPRTDESSSSRLSACQCCSELLEVPTAMEVEGPPHFFVQRQNSQLPASPRPHYCLDSAQFAHANPHPTCSCRSPGSWKIHDPGILLNRCIMRGFESGRRSTMARVPIAISGMNLSMSGSHIVHHLPGFFGVGLSGRRR